MARLATLDAVSVSGALLLEALTVLLRHGVVAALLGGRHAVPRAREVLHDLPGRPVWVQCFHDASLLHILTCFAWS
jgi:hypothetical protein